MNPDIKKTFAVLNQMVADRVIENYAVGGAIAAIFFFLSQDAVELAALEDVITRHGLSTRWADYKRNS